MGKGGAAIEGLASLDRLVTVTVDVAPIKSALQQVMASFASMATLESMESLKAEVDELRKAGPGKKLLKKISEMVREVPRSSGCLGIGADSSALCVDQGEGLATAQAKQNTLEARVATLESQLSSRGEAGETLKEQMGALAAQMATHVEQVNEYHEQQDLVAEVSPPCCPDQLQVHCQVCKPHRALCSLEA